MSKESKPPVEFALDNRQTFFLFFGLSVVGCFVFALGVVVGRQELAVPGFASEEPPKIAGEAGDLDFLAAAEPVPIEAPDSFSFKDGIAVPATAGIPETRDPAVKPRDEKTVKAERASQEAKEAKDASKAVAKRAPEKPKTSSSEPQSKRPAVLATAEPAETVEVKPVAPRAAPTEANDKASDKDDAKATETPPPGDTVMAAGSGETAEAEVTSKKKRAFTLQLKAYTNPEDAEKMADKLRRNGHEVRVEVGEVQGRAWHRVRIGEFTRWDDALEAKAEFEKREEIIAYVVPR